MLILGIIVLVLCTAAYAIIAIRAPLGFEDETGFHRGDNAVRSIPDSDERFHGDNNADE